MKTKIIKLQITTSDGVLSKSVEIEIPDSTSDLSNDSGFLTESDISETSGAQGVSVFYSTATSGTSVELSTITPASLSPLVGDRIMFSNGDLREVTAVSSSTVSCGSVLANFKGDKGDTGAQGEKGEKGEKGDAGSNGVTFTPSIDSAGNLSWSNDGGLPNPSTINVKGLPGIDGENGKNVLYIVPNETWTDNDVSLANCINSDMYITNVTIDDTWLIGDNAIIPYFNSTCSANRILGGEITYLDAESESVGIILKWFTN